MIRIRTLGKGGFGIVSLYQSKSGAFYAVKEMTSAWDADHFERFRRELVIMNKQSPKNFIQILKLDWVNNNPFYVTPFFEEGNLTEYLLNQKSKGNLISFKSATGFIYHLAGVMNEAHLSGTIHRNLKPENILFDKRDIVITDWGLGKFIHKESAVFYYGEPQTISYCAPEQWNHGVSDQRADIYSLGLIYRNLLIGKLTGSISDSKINAIINQMTMMRPDERYQDMKDVMLDIQALNILSTSPLNDFWDGFDMDKNCESIEEKLNRLLVD